jgi:hypothetical protein
MSQFDLSHSEARRLALAAQGGAQPVEINYRSG